MNEKNLNAKEKLLQKISEASFAMVDLQLFLDTHPKDEQALFCYKEAVKIRRELMHEYACAYGPLTLDTACECGCGSWEWIRQPFPWEKEGGCC